VGTTANTAFVCTVIDQLIALIRSFDFEPDIGAVKQSLFQTLMDDLNGGDNAYLVQSQINQAVGEPRIFWGS
jgi:hypothetical protein